MYCTQCSTELDSNARFCSSCGTPVPGTSMPPVPQRDWNLHVSILGWLVIAHAVLTGLIGFVVIFVGQVARSFILQNPRIFEDVNPRDLPPPEVLNAIGPFSFLIGMIFLLIALPSVAAGVGLLRYRSWGRVLTLILSFLRLLEFPFGTATAIYSFWVLLSRGGKDFYSEKAMRAEV